MPEILTPHIMEIIEVLSIIGLLIAFYVITQMISLLSKKDQPGIIEGFAIFTIIVSGFAIYVFLKRLGTIP